MIHSARPRSLASSEHCFRLKFVLFCEKWERTDGRTDVAMDDMCGNNDQYRP